MLLGALGDLTPHEIVESSVVDVSVDPDELLAGCPGSSEFIVPRIHPWGTFAVHDGRLTPPDSDDSDDSGVR